MARQPGFDPTDPATSPTIFDCFFEGFLPRISAHTPEVPLHPFLASHANIFHAIQVSKTPWMCKLASLVRRPFARNPDGPNSPEDCGFMRRLHSRSPEGPSSPPTSKNGRRLPTAGKNPRTRRFEPAHLTDLGICTSKLSQTFPTIYIHLSLNLNTSLISKYTSYYTL